MAHLFSSGDYINSLNGLNNISPAVPVKVYGRRGLNLATDSPAAQYQTQKIIQNTVRVGSSLYTMNLAGLSGFQFPSLDPQIVEQAGTPYEVPALTYWNQMSDRAHPSNQTVKIASGSRYHTSSTKHTITRNRPGAMSPGGIGVDIKHNSYERRLNKLKGKHVLRRGVIPPNYGEPIVFNRAFPVYGGKTVKTAIIGGCDCLQLTQEAIQEQNARIYGSELNALQEQILAVEYTYSVGDFVWAKKWDQLFYKAQITSIENGQITIRFVDDGSTQITTADYIMAYFDCDCPSSTSLVEDILANRNDPLTQSSLLGYLDCKLLAIQTNGGLS